MWKGPCVTPLKHYTRTIIKKYLSKDPVISKLKNEAMLELCNKCVVPSLTFGSESWMYNNREMENLIVEKIQ